MALQNKPLFDADAAEEYFVDLLVYYRNVANDIFKRDNEGRHASEQTYSAEYQKFVGMQSAMKEVLDYFSKFELKGGEGKALRRQEERRWVPVTEQLPENAAHPGAFCPRYMVTTKYGVTEGWYNPDRESWFVLFWFMTERLLEHEINFESGDIPRVIKVPLHMGIVTAWLPLPEPYTPEVEENT